MARQGEVRSLSARKHTHCAHLEFGVYDPKLTSHVAVVGSRQPRTQTRGRGLCACLDQTGLERISTGTTGFRGGLNWYRNIDRNWQLRAPWAGAKITVPALYVVGEHDLVMKFAGVEQLIANMKLFVPQLQKTVILPDCGHWTQQERAAEVNALLIEFLGRLELH